MRGKNKLFQPFFFFGVTLFFLLPSAASAQEELSPSPPISEEAILFQEIPSVYSASKYEQKITEAPSSVSIVTAAEIKKYGYRTLADILRSLRGFFTTFDRNYTYVGVRGFGRPADYNSRILLLIDGHRINDNIYDGFLPGTDFILDVDIIDRVEVIRGPSSSLYGANAFFAVINIITRSGRNLKGAEVSGSAASFDTYTGRLTYGNKFRNGPEALLSGSLMESKGQNLFFKEFDSPDTNNGIAEHCDYDRSHSFFAKSSFRDFTFEAAYSWRKKGIPTASFGTVFDDPRNNTIDDRYFADLKYEHYFSSRLGLTARTFYDWYGYHGDYIFDYPPITVNKDFARGAWWGGEVKLITTLMNRHKLIAGAEYRDNILQHQGNFDEDPYHLYLDDRRTSKNLGLYVQDEFTVFNKLILNLGIRYDHFDTFGGTTNPRLALIYNPFEKTFFKLLYGRAFRAPNNFELYYDDGGLSSKSNPDLKPETINTYELIYEQYFGDYFRFTADSFYYKINNLISQQIDPADGLLVFQNIESVKATGFELELEGRLPSGIEGRISYTYQDAKNDATKERLTNSPLHLAKANVIMPLLRDKLFVGTEVQYTSKRKTLSGNAVNDFITTNVTLFAQNLVRALELSASVYNLFNKNIGDPGGGEHRQDVIQQDGRNYRVKLTYAF